MALIQVTQLVYEFISTQGQMDLLSLQILQKKLFIHARAKIIIAFSG